MSAHIAPRSLYFTIFGALMVLTALIPVAGTGIVWVPAGGGRSPEAVAEEIVARLAGEEAA